MKLPKDYFDNLSASKYRQYLKLLPDMHEENSRLITMLVYTFIALSFFGIFAIKPTLSTIVELKKQLADSTYTHQQLSQKLSNLSALQQRYNTLTPDLPVIGDAIPQSAQAPILMGQIEALARESRLTITSFRIGQVQLAGGKAANNQSASSYIFTMEAQGSYENMMTFAETVTKINRIVTVEALSIGKNNKNDSLVLTMRGRQYFKK